MIDIWVKLVSVQFELAANLTRAVFGVGEREAPASAHRDPSVTRMESQTGADQAGAATISSILSFLESSDRGATVREIAEHLKMDRKAVLPLLKTLVKEKRIDELLGRYCVLKA